MGKVDFIDVISINMKIDVGFIIIEIFIELSKFKLLVIKRELRLVLFFF